MSTFLNVLSKMKMKIVAFVTNELVLKFTSSWPFFFELRLGLKTVYPYIAI